MLQSEQLKYQQQENSELTSSHKTRCLEAIAILNFHRQQNHNRAVNAIARANKVANTTALLVFAVMTYFLHAALLGGNEDITTHILAFILNIVIALVTTIMIRELHPAKANGLLYWETSIEYERQAKILERELNKSGPLQNVDICQQTRKASVASALSIADSLFQQ